MDDVVVVPEWDLADRLIKARRYGRVSRPEMADYLGMHRNSLGAYESGRARPTLAVLRSWAQLTGIDLDWLRYGDGEPRPEVVGSTAKKSRQKPRTVASFLAYGPRRHLAAA